MASSEPTVEEDLLGGIAGSAVGDHPTHADRLGFKPYVEAIAGFLLADATKPPITISIEGEWGSGKSSFLLQLEDAIAGERPFDAFLNALPPWLGGKSADRSIGSIASAWKKLRGPRPPLTVRFNAWRHDKQDSLWAAFALAFVQSLRSEIGFRRAYLGDLHLFLKRLTGLRGWLQLILLLCSALILGVGLFAFGIYIVRLAPADLKTLLAEILKPTQGSSGIASSLTSLAAHGAWGAIAAVGAAGVYKFHSRFKLPLSLNLEKYLSKPDYGGHVAFIESFHLDLKRLIEAYAGNERVFVFVDDLDRCDVPRAAELMQAINLMIGDAGNLIFILGMDREKVAAGVALKYKDLFPFLRESAQWKPGVDKDDVTPLYFGYAYLEKFIQISFVLPIPNDAATLDNFLTERPIAAPTHWRKRLWQYWSTRLRTAPKSGDERPGLERNTFGPPVGEPAGTPSSSPIDRPEPVRVEYNRVEIKEDSHRIRRVVRMVTELFENNPRRLKQFINTFRLALYIASDQGLFDRPRPGSASSPPAHTPTPEQIGKFCALLLRFPDLRYKLIENTKFLAQLQIIALSENALPHWLQARGARDLLAYNLGEDVPPAKRDRYSLEHLDIERLITILPRAARPSRTAPGWATDFAALSTEDQEILRHLMNAAEKYEALQETQPQDADQLRVMRDLFRDGVAKAGRLTPQGHRLAVALPGSLNEPGRRLMRIAVADAQYDPADTEWLLQMLDDFKSSFEYSWSIETLRLYLDRIPAQDKARIVQILNRHEKENWNAIKNDPGRILQAEQLRQSASGAHAPSPAFHIPPPSPAGVSESMAVLNTPDVSSPITETGEFTRIFKTSGASSPVTEIGEFTRIIRPPESASTISMTIDELERVSQKKQGLADVWETFYTQHRVGDVVHGKVLRTAQFGVFVEVAEGVEGLCHVSEAVDAHGQPIHLEQGQEHDFMIIQMNLEEKKVGLSIRAVSEKMPASS